jgi:flagellar hook assembly protein FlgD
MPLQHVNTTVSTAVKLLVKIPSTVKAVATQIYNNTGATIYIGDASITSSGATIGNAIANGASVQIWLNSLDELYVICGSSPAGYVSVIYSA